MKNELNQVKHEKENVNSRKKEAIWDKVEIQITEKPLEANIKLVNGLVSRLLASSEDLVSRVKTLTDSSKSNLKPHLEVECLRENLKNVTGFMEVRERYVGEQLDYLAGVVNKMESEISRSVPEELKNIGLHIAPGYTSPTLMCIQLKEECVRIEAEYKKLRTQISAESNNNLQSMGQLQQRVEDLTEELKSTTAKYNEEKEKREKLLAFIHEKEGEAFDLIRFRRVLEENKMIKKQNEDLTQQLLAEKHIKINEMYNEKFAMDKIAVLSSELDLLNNTKLVLTQQLHDIKSVHQIQMQERNIEIEDLKKENSLVLERIQYISKTVESLRRSVYESNEEQGRSDIEKLKSTLTLFVKELNDLRIEQNSRKTTFENEVRMLIGSLSERVEDKSYSILNIVGKNDRNYISEINSLKSELKTVQNEKTGITNELYSSREHESSLSKKMNELEQKLSSLETIEDNHNIWMDGNIDCTTSLEVERATKALMKSLETIDYLKQKIQSMQQGQNPSQTIILNK